MPHIARYAILAWAVFALLAGSAWADGWPIANVFSASNNPSAVKITKKKGLQKSIGKRAKPGMVDTLTSAPKKLYSSTKSMVTPSKKSSGQKSGKTGFNSQAGTWGASKASQKSNSQSGQKPSGIKGWLAPEPPPLPRTVGEWMAQKRVDP